MRSTAKNDEGPWLKAFSPSMGSSASSARSGGAASSGRSASSGAADGAGVTDAASAPASGRTSCAHSGQNANNTMNAAASGRRIRLSFPLPS
ncbi:MAG: hypothetical protein LBN92_06970 [Treponema sp.]|nr:hypothetical protein [Treponema sp.]